MIKAGKPLVLMILDGWGMKQGGDNDALSLAQLPNFDHLWNTYPHTQLDASGMDVGLPEGQIDVYKRQGICRMTCCHLCN